MSDSGWSWSPRQALALAQLDPNRATAKQHDPSSAAAKIKPKAAATSTNKKRKSDAVSDDKENAAPLVDISDNDPRLQVVTDSCQTIRRKITSFIDSGAMKIGEFQIAIGVSSGAYLRFMNQSGSMKGDGCDTYWKAFVFFKKRELQGLKPPTQPSKKRAKPEEKGIKTDPYDVSGIILDDEEEGEVPVYDTCDEIRKKIRAFLKKDGVTQAGFCRAISRSYPDGRSVATGSLAAFLNRKGAKAGNTSGVFYGSYVFFEKLRLKQGKPKSAMREDMEDIWTGAMAYNNNGRAGFDVTNHTGCYYIVSAGKQLYEDKYGRLFGH